MRVRDLGEFALIDALLDVLPDSVRQSARVPLGIGDDGALWQPSQGTQSVITTDALVEGIHFRTDWTDWRSLGHKLLAVNLSDIAAMGARAVLATVTLFLTGEESVDDLREMYRGAADLAAPHGVVLAGGDIVRTPGPFSISVTAIGETSRPLARSGARPGDRIVVSGTLGASAAGLELHRRPELAVKATTSELLIGAHLRPQPRLALGALLAEVGATSCMDLSDGLLGDLPKILAVSDVGARVRTERVPVLPAVRALFPEDWLRLALRGGEDYELLATIPAGRLDDAVLRAADVGSTLTDIGEIVRPLDRERRLTLIDGMGVAIDVDSGAFDHFG